MKSTIAIILLLVSFQLASSKKTDIASLLVFATQNNDNCVTPGLQCKDCENIQYCSSNLESLFAIRCEDQSRSRPYCDSQTNTCVEDKPEFCNIAEATFHCPGTGMYPDLDDCASYYNCDENRIATKFACPIGSNYVHPDRKCTAGVFCRPYSGKSGQCKGKTNKLIAYTPSKDLYILCLAKGPLLLQCPKKGDTFDETEVTCKFQCTQNGFFPYPEDSKKFYSCIQSGKKFVQDILECPEGTEFVEIGEAQGICTYRTTTTTTTEAEITTTDIPEDSSHSNEEEQGTNHEEEENIHVEPASTPAHEDSAEEEQGNNHEEEENIHIEPASTPAHEDEIIEDKADSIEDQTAHDVIEDNKPEENADYDYNTQNVEVEIASDSISA